MIYRLYKNNIIFWLHVSMYDYWFVTHDYLMVLGMDSWKRMQIHSHVYRVPDPFRNEVRLNLYILWWWLWWWWWWWWCMVIGGGGGWELNEWTRHINGACGSGKGSSFKCQVTWYLLWPFQSHFQTPKPSSSSTGSI